MIKWRLRPVKSLKLNDKNPRTIKDPKFEELVKSIQNFPKMLEIRPIVVNSDSVVIGGNMRLRACLKAGIKEVPVIEAKDLTEAEQREFIIKDNVGFGEWDFPAIEANWPEAEDWGLEIPDFPNTTELADDEFEIPDEIKTDIKVGDLFEVGPHRLLCGDSTKAEDVKKLTKGEFLVLMVTDPPYGVNYNADWRNKALRANGLGPEGRAIGKVTNDHEVDWKLAYDLFKGTVCYVWHAGINAKEICQNIEDAGFVIVSQIIWAKNGHVIGRGDYHWQHEPCWYAVRKNKNHNWQGSRSEKSLWEIDRPHKSETGHSTQKPVECMARPIRNNSKQKEKVYDPFGGSGTTMVAGHQLGRIVYMMELEPKYCQVVIDRMRKLDPTISIKKNGVICP